MSGTARVVTDRALIRSRYQPDWKAWFGAIDEVCNGGPDDPCLALILVHAHSVIYMKCEKSKPAVLFEVAKGMVTGEPPEIGRTKKLNLAERAPRAFRRCSRRRAPRRAPAAAPGFRSGAR